MTLGEKLRSTRIEAGMTQRQLCGEEITRNMLSQIENGSARPSMKTLQYLAARLGKTVSFFLEEEGAVSPNRRSMDRAREAFDAGDMAAALEALADYREPDAVFDREKQMLVILARMVLAQQALEQGRYPYARELMEQVVELGKTAAYYTEDLEKRRLMLLAQVPGTRVQLPGLDLELLTHAGAAVTNGDWEQARSFLEAVQDKNQPRWNLLRGEIYWQERSYIAAKACYHAAEERYPKETAHRLEQCYRELGDFKRAYEYACKQR